MIFHLYSHFPNADAETQRRNRVAQLTWKKQLWKELPVQDEDLPKLYVEGDRRFPYVKDLFDVGCRGCSDIDIICYTNADIMVRSDTYSEIAGALQESNAVYCFRRDFNHRIDKPIDDADFVKGVFYPGKDLFAFRVKWWNTYRNDFPDMILAFEAWDAVLQELMDLTNPKGKTALRDLICHEKHSSRWERAENRYTLPGQKLCLTQAALWMRKHGINPSRHGIKAV